MNLRIPPKQMALKVVKLIRKQNPDDNYLRKTFEHIRNELNVHRTNQPKTLPQLLTDEEMRQFYESVFIKADGTHMMMIKLLIYTGIRNSELVNLTLDDVDITTLRIFIRKGKGKKDRIVLIPEYYRGELSLYILSRLKVKKENRKDSGFLFQSNRNDQYSTRWIRKIIKHYADEAGIKKRIYPHLLRHQFLTFLTRENIVDAKIQLISGHSDRKSLSIYQDLSLVDVESEYQEAMKKFPVV